MSDATVSPSRYKRKDSIKGDEKMLAICPTQLLLEVIATEKQKSFRVANLCRLGAGDTRE